MVRTYFIHFLIVYINIQRVRKQVLATYWVLTLNNYKSCKRKTNVKLHRFSNNSSVSFKTLFLPFFLTFFNICYAENKITDNINAQPIETEAYIYLNYLNYYSYT